MISGCTEVFWRPLIFHSMSCKTMKSSIWMFREENKNKHQRSIVITHELTGWCPQSGVQPACVPHKHRLHLSRITPTSAPANAYRTWERTDTSDYSTSSHQTNRETPAGRQKLQQKPLNLKLFIATNKIKANI